MSAGSVPSPPRSFPEVPLKTLPPDTILHRIHRSDFQGDSFNPCQGPATRFAPVTTPAGTCVPTLYAATSLDAAIYESVFHDIPYDAVIKTVKKQDIDCRTYSILKIKTPLRCAQLFEPDLRRWGLTRRNLIDTCSSAYGDTVAWARAIHVKEPAAAGLIWTSRQCDPDLALLLFGDRVGSNDFALEESTAVTASPALLRSIHDAGRRAGITITL